MKSSRPIILMLMAVVGLGATIVAIKKGGGAKPGGGTGAVVKVLVAKTKLGYGSELIAVAKEDGPEPNVELKSWPAGLVPADVMTQDDAKGLAKEPLVVRTVFEKGMPILKAQTVTRESFLPEGMMLQKLTVSAHDVKVGTFKAGSKVDVSYYSAGAYQDLMKCVRIFAIGSITDTGLPGPTKFSNGEAVVFLDVPKSDAEQFAVARKAHKELTLFPAKDDTLPGPVFVTKENTEPDAGAEQALVRVGKLDAVKVEADALVAAGKYAEAADVLSKGDELAKQALESRQAFVRGFCERAQAACDQKDYAGALRVLGELEAAEASMAHVRKLRSDIAVAEAVAQRADAYAGLLKTIRESLESGDLPASQLRIADLDPYIEDNYEPAEGTAKPAAARDELQKELIKRQGEYEQAERVLKAHVKDRKADQARLKLDELKKKFRAHPNLKDWEAQVKKLEQG